MKWIDPTEEAVYWVASHLRAADEMEVALSDGLPGHLAVLMSWSDSKICRAIATDDGVPCGLTGVNGDRIWMLGTDDLTATKCGRLQLCREGRGWVEYCLQRVGGPLWNDVYWGNRRSIHWLKRLGFTVEDPRPLGPSGALFSRFWRMP